MESPRWNIITPSQFEWERRGLDFIRTGLPDHDPYRAWANLGTPVSALGLSNRARNALERANVITVRDLLLFPIGDIHLMKGVGNQTRQEIIRFVGELREKFPNVEALKPKDQPTPDESAGPPSLENLHHRIVGARNPKKDAEWNMRAGLLGVTAPASQSASQWPSQTDVAEALSVTRARIGQIVSADRNRWGKDAQITAFRHELCEQIQRLGGVVTIAEIIDLTILLRPAANTLDSAQQQRLASAVARAAVETEDMMAQRRFQMRRVAAHLAQRREHLLLVNPGMIARYDLMAILETLRDKVGHDAPCPCLWVLVASDGQNDMPILDHAEIPLITPGQRAKVSESWIDNVHRGRAEKVASTLTTAKGGN